MKRRLHIIMPMAGEGSRFKAIGIDTPKPMLKVGKKKSDMFMFRALKSIPYKKYDYTVTFIVRQEHIDNYRIDDYIAIGMKKGHYNIVAVDKTTGGAVETCLLAKPYIQNTDAILVLDCDLEFKSAEYNKVIDFVMNDDLNNPMFGGCVLSFKSDIPKYSYAECDKYNNVIRTAEKEVISNNALAGAYFFGNATDFLWAAETLIRDNELSEIKEYYTSLLYNKLIRTNINIYLANVDEYSSFGTPEELEEYNKTH